MMKPKIFCLCISSHQAGLQPMGFRPWNRAAGRSGFTLIELLFVISIISLLASLLFPVFMTVRGKARQMACASNLRQIGMGVQMYLQDYDGRYPHAVDATDRADPDQWSGTPAFAAAIPKIGLVQDVLHSYVKERRLFRCPSDTGFSATDFMPGVPLDARPSSFEKYGSSYYYRTEIAVRQSTDASLKVPDQVNLLFDAAGAWHGTFLMAERRYNVLFADGHVKNVNRQKMDEAWGTPLS